MTNRFHAYHGQNILLEDGHTVAVRSSGFGYGVVFSERNLKPGELFLIEVDQNERGWCGYLRLGLTEMNPSVFSKKKLDLPKFAVPDLCEIASTWMYPLCELKFDIGPKCDLSWPFDIDPNKISISDKYIKTCMGSYPRINLQYTPDPSSKKSQEFEVGHRIGVIFIPDNENVADLYYILDGNVCGPYAVGLPYKDRPLFAVIDLYGKTKKIRVLQVQAEKSLKQMCRLVILQTFNLEKINKLPLPKSIIDYLHFNSSTSR